MLVLLTADLFKPESVSAKDFYEVWRKESVAASAAAKNGPIKGIWKVAGEYQVIAVVEVESGEQIDEIVHSLPIWSEGYAHIIKSISFKPLSPYSEWAEQLKTLAN